MLLFAKWNDASVIRNNHDKNLFNELHKRLMKRESGCLKPYHIKISANNCTWNCADGTEPDNTTKECQCKDGYYQTEVDNYGRRVCTPCLKPYQMLTSATHCVWNCAKGTQPDSVARTCVCNDGFYETGLDEYKRLVCEVCPKPYRILTGDNRCEWNCNNGSHPDQKVNQCVCNDGYYEIDFDRPRKRICVPCTTAYNIIIPGEKCAWNCAENTEPDLATNECICIDGYFQTGIDDFGRRICRPKKS